MLQLVEVCRPQTWIMVLTIAPRRYESSEVTVGEGEKQNIRGRQAEIDGLSRLIERNGLGAKKMHDGLMRPHQWGRARSASKAARLRPFSPIKTR